LPFKVLLKPVDVLLLLLLVENQRELLISGLIPGAQTVNAETIDSRNAQPRAVDKVDMSLTE
jgi:hypothetical protein